MVMRNGKKMRVSECKLLQCVIIFNKTISSCSRTHYDLLFDLCYPSLYWYGVEIKSQFLRFIPSFIRLG